MNRRIELWYTDKNGQRDYEDFTNLRKAKSALRSGEYNSAMVDVFFYDKEGELIDDKIISWCIRDDGTIYSI